MAALQLTIRVSPAFALSVLLGTVVMCLGAAALSFHRVAHIDPALVFRS